MTVGGAGTSADDLNAAAVDIAQRFAATARDALLLAKYVDRIDVAGLQQAGFASTAEAQDYKDCVDYEKTVAQIITGIVGQADPFDFTDRLSKYVGPTPKG